MIKLSIESFEQWRRYARLCLERCILPEKIMWQSIDEAVTQDLFMGNDTCSEGHNQLSDSLLKGYPVVSHDITVPKTFMSQAKYVACFRETRRWSLLYRIAWQLVIVNKHILADRCDPLVAQFYKMQKVIARDKHKMEAFVRFKRVDELQLCDRSGLPFETVDGQLNTHENLDEGLIDSSTKDSIKDSSQEYYVAWFEPEHYIMSITAPYFIKRFANMNWSILSPSCCIHWDQKTLQMTEGVSRPANIDDQIESLWLTYYKNIFNPARLKINAMQSEMPKKYWHNLPEAVLIPELIRGATQKMESMVAHTGTNTNDSFVNSRYVKTIQKQLRDRPSTND